MVIAHDNGLIYPDSTALHPAYAYTPHIVVVVNAGNKHLHGGIRVPLGSGDMVQYRFKKGHKIGSLLVLAERSGSSPPRTEQHRAFYLLVACIQVEEQLQNLVSYLVKPRVGTVYLVHHDDYFQTHFQRLLQYEAGLGHTALGSVNKQYDAVHHFKYPLHLAAEIRVTRSVDNVYLHAVIHHSRVLRKDSDTPLPLQIVGVHYSLGDVLVLPERAPLLEHFVHQRSFAVVYVRDNSYVS